jgi:hypothetical protein
MLSSITGPRASQVLAGLAPQQTTPSGSSDSFTQQLTSALEGYLAQSGSGSNLEIDIQTTQSQDSGVRQFLVTVKNPDSAAGQAGAAASPASTAPAASGVPADGTTFPGFASIPASASPAASTNTPANVTGATRVDNTTPPAAPMSEADAYWAAQPPEVQQLRDVTDLATRSAMAQQLADQGFTIDKAIMVWGWDPLKTMLTRQMYGYTWAPNMNQGNVSTPGITLIGQTPYDPKNPPPGSIAVKTDFAQGTKVSDPWSASQLKLNT